jgi:hypothetical protein
MPEYKVRLVGGAEDEVATILTTDGARFFHISFHYRGRVIEAEATDYFKAFCHVRLQLEAEKLIPFCYGASRNVYPSGMCRDMGRGLKAYRVTHGKQTTMQDLVDIFNQGPDVVPAYVAEQRRYWEAWLESVRSIPKKQLGK